MKRVEARTFCFLWLSDVPMTPLFTELRARIPANKFYPPRLDPAQYLFRMRLVEEILESFWTAPA
jgi:hypothetical protein